MQRLVEILESLCVEVSLIVVPHEFKHESFIEYRICGALDQLCAEPVLEHTNSHRQVFILFDVNEVDESVSFDYVDA